MEERPDCELFGSSLPSMSQNNSVSNFQDNHSPNGEDDHTEDLYNPNPRRVVANRHLSLPVGDQHRAITPINRRRSETETVRPDLSVPLSLGMGGSKDDEVLYRDSSRRNQRIFHLSTIEREFGLDDDASSKNIDPTSLEDDNCSGLMDRLVVDSSGGPSTPTATATGYAPNFGEYLAVDDMSVVSDITAETAWRNRQSVTEGTNVLVDESKPQSGEDGTAVPIGADVSATGSTDVSNGTLRGSVMKAFFRIVQDLLLR